MVIQAAEKHSVFTQGDIFAFLKENWVFPQSGRKKQRDLPRLFSETGRKANAEGKSIKGSMGEMLGLYGLLRHFVETRCPADERIATELRLFAMSCKAVDQLLAAKHGLVTLQDLSQPLMQLLEKQMQLRVRASARVVPKHHWAFDIAECFSQTELPILLDTFGTERLHLRTKAVAEHVDNMGTFEESVLSRVVALHASSLEDRWAPTADLLGKSVPLPDDPNVVVADGCRHYGATYHVHDFCYRGLRGWMEIVASGAWRLASDQLVNGDRGVGECGC